MTSTTGSQATQEAPYYPIHDTSPLKPVYPFPTGACDTHAHICGPESTFKYDGKRIYTPHDALLPDFEHMLKTLGVARIVLVQPSIYGYDNQVMLKAMGETALQSRGVAVLPMDITDAKLEEFHKLGIRGVRFNIVDVKNPKGELDMAGIRRFAERVKPLGWHVEFLLHVDDFDDFGTRFGNFPTDIVVGHLGYFRPGCPLEDPSFKGLLDLAEAGKCWVKMTGPYRITAQEFPYADVDPYAHALVKRAPHRLIWGSDWPHAMCKKAMPNDGPLADLLARWAPDESVRRQILVDNPVRLYQF